MSGQLGAAYRTSGPVEAWGPDRLDVFVVGNDNALYHKTLGLIYKAAGLGQNAKRELQAALRLDPKDAEAKQELKTL